MTLGPHLTAVSERLRAPTTSSPTPAIRPMTRRYNRTVHHLRLFVPAEGAASYTLARLVLKSAGPPGQPTSSRPLRGLRQVDPEHLGEAGAALVREVDGAAALGTAQPAEGEQAGGQGGPDAAGQVRALLAPIDAVGDRRAARRQAVQVGAELLQEGGALPGQPVADGPARRGGPVAPGSPLPG